ncbi:MAG: hypothetical protein OEY85_11245, partial [Rhodospirillales bacterium]|nr:hypothetical protein [Rhodospirillales bacterium]
AVIWAWRAKAAVPGGAPLKAAVLCLATLLATPFGYTYDLLIMALALAWLGWDIHLRGWRKWDVAVMSAAFLLPFASPGIARLVPVQIGPWVILALLAAIIFRMRWRPATDSG